MKSLSSARPLFAACALAAAFGISACSSSDVAGTDLKPVGLSFTAGAKTSTSVIGSVANALSSTPAVIPAVTRIQIVITKMELGRSDDVACVDDGDDDDRIESSSSTSTAVNHECEHVSRDPLLIDMPVDGTLRTQISVPLAAGTYRKLEAKLGVVSNKTPSGAAFLTAHPEFAGVSLRADGTFKGVPFTYKTGLKAHVKMRFSPALVIDATTKNATVSVDVSKWFVTVNGDVIDPSRASPGTPAAMIIENNIRASFHAFKDNGKSGKDEGEGRNGNE